MVILPPDTGSSSLLQVARHREGGPPHRPSETRLQIGGACESSENTRTKGGAGRRDYVLPTAYSTRPCDRLEMEVEVEVVQPDGERALVVGKLDVAG
jgi:hypothetical protein